MKRLLAGAGVVLGVMLAAGMNVPAAGATPAGALPTGAPVAVDSVGIRLLDAPSERRDDPRARLYIVDHLAPGTTISRRLEVSNTTAAPVTVQLYPAAASIQDGGFQFAEGRQGNELTDWTRIDPPTVTVPAGGTALATATIAVDPRAAEGERYGVLWAELPPAAGGTITTINRVGVRMYLSVGPGGEPPADFRITGVRPERGADGTPLLMVGVTNTGGRALDLNGELRLAGGPGGVSAGPFDSARTATLGTGQSGEVAFALAAGLPAGPWEAGVTVRSGRTERSTDADVTFPAAGIGESGSGDGPPLLALLGGGAALVAVAALLLVRRRRAGRP